MIEISIPTMPPSVNYAYATDWQTKRRFKTKKCRDWEAEAGWWVNARKNKETLKGDVKVTYTFQRKRKKDGTPMKADVSNYIKAPEDLLVSCGVIADDSLVMSFTAQWSDDVEGVVIVVEAI